MPLHVCALLLLLLLLLLLVLLLPAAWGGVLSWVLGAAWCGVARAGSLGTACLEHVCGSEVLEDAHRLVAPPGTPGGVLV